jgi:hypothetical protein
MQTEQDFSSKKQDDALTLNYSLILMELTTFGK